MSHDQVSKPPIDKQKVLPLSTSKKKADKNCSATGGSLANFWSHASAKSKTCSLPTEMAAADTQICAREAGEGGSSDDDSQDVTLRISLNSERSRKRRVVLDFSDDDEFEDAINLASPNFPNRQSVQDDRKNDKNSSEKVTTNFDLKIADNSKVKEERAADRETNQPPTEGFSVINKCTSTGKLSTENSHSCGPEIHVNERSNLDNAAPGSPKRRKVLKTRIDERGREVTEVVWEGMETEAKKADRQAATETVNGKWTSSWPGDTLSRDEQGGASAAKKSAAIAKSTSSSGKGGSKKAGNSKDLKQGNILSFFKRG